MNIFQKLRDLLSKIRQIIMNTVRIKNIGESVKEWVRNLFSLPAITVIFISIVFSIIFAVLVFRENQYAFRDVLRASLSNRFYCLRRPFSELLSIQYTL